MDTERFWQIIENATGHDPETAEDWDSQLVEQLVKLPADEILAWDRIFSDLTSRLYRNDLWAAAYLINGSGSDDGFYYFRCWLVGMGRDVCMNALKDPDSLADVVHPNWLADGIDAEAEIYAAGFRAWQQVTGTTDEVPYPVQNPKTELAGEAFDFDDNDVMQRVLPRLCKLIDN
ncbi:MULTISPECIES: DUF4240 domain-containing protein [Rhodopirellula]|uniref:DUF4240 domain-containing protein n=1 Tax=Rhodopirellula TaxID=265488 RepID=UPI00257F6ED8|nr:DUF4240 domain-containing protein [Rhodopirellula sp. UBA1907]